MRDFDRLGLGFAGGPDASSEGFDGCDGAEGEASNRVVGYGGVYSSE